MQDQVQGHETPLNTKKKISFGVLISSIAVIILFILWKSYYFILLSFLGILVSIFITSISTPVARYLRIRHSIAVSIIVSILVIGLGLAIWWMSYDLAAQLDELVQRIPDAIQRVYKYLESNPLGRAIIGQFSHINNWIESSGIFQRAGTFVSSSVGGISNFVIVSVIGFFLALNPGLYISGLVSLTPPHQHKDLYQLLKDLNKTLQWWIIGRVFSMFIIGFATWIGLGLLGVQPALTLAILSGLLSFIPFLGPILASVPALLLAFINGFDSVLYVLILYSGIQFIEGNLLTPIVEKRTVLLPPALTIFAQIIFGLLFGLLGILLASPFTAMILVLVKRLYIEPMNRANSKRLKQNISADKA